tara:strand:- start:85 stop:861 length:777 start_codon:yes stop_codon:yes gene_type:complete
MDFKKDFFKLLGKLKRGENFAYTRFSDGEIAIMQGKILVLQDDRVIFGDTVHNFGYSENDHKEFDPKRDKFLTDKLIEAYKHKQEDYFVGGICRNCTCASQEFGPWMRELYGEDDDSAMSTNLLVNSNYPMFVNHFIKEFKNKSVVIVCNENAKFDNLPFEVVKDFRVGKNCIINDHHLVDEMKAYIDDNNVEDHVFLFSASSLSEVLIYELFKHNSKNTYIDIGTTLHPYLDMELARDYLRAYWASSFHPDLLKNCS